MKLFAYLSAQPPSEDEIEMAAQSDVELEHVPVMEGALFDLGPDDWLRGKGPFHGVVTFSVIAALRLIPYIPVAVFRYNQNLHLVDFVICHMGLSSKESDSQHQEVIDGAV